ncbi:MAG: amidase family protein [Pseudomonadota bacterium]
MSESWLWESAAALGRGIGAGEIDPVALTETYLSAIAAHPESDRIYARVTAGRARAEAAAAAERARHGTRRGPLDGVPVSWKDLVDSAGVATEAGSALLKGRVPAADAPILANATRAGLVCLGKTHLSELAFSGLGLNPVTATPPNVHDAARAPGGSSSGAAASIAFGLAAGAIGSDTGGSVRIPAAWAGLVGLKTTPGRLPLTGIVPLAKRFDTIGPLARTVEDAALLTAAMEGSAPPDLTGVALAGRSFLIAEDYLEGAAPGILAAFEAACETLRTAGATLDRGPVPEIAGALRLAAGAPITGEAYGLWRDEIERAPDLMFDYIRDRFRLGAKFDAPTYVAEWEELEALAAGIDARLAPYDALLGPATANLPPELERLWADESHYVTENLLALRNTRTANLLGLASLTVPSATAFAGVMLTGRAGSEAALLRIGAALAPRVH